MVGAIQGSIVGAGSGAAVGFAGGKGTVEDVFKHMLAGFITGAITGAALGAFSGFLNGDNGSSVFKIGTLDKYTGAAGNVSTANNALQFPQNVGDLVNGSPMGLGGSFTSLGTGSQAWTLSNIFNVAGNGALITIPVGWVPSALVTYGGIIAVEDISMTLDATGVASFSNQLVLALSLVPFLGILFGYGLLKDSTWETKAEQWVDNGLSQASPNVI